MRVVETGSAERFVGRATFEGITGAPVLVGEFEPDSARGAYPGDPAPEHAAISHLELARRADVYAIAPASELELVITYGTRDDELRVLLDSGVAVRSLKEAPPSAARETSSR